MQRGIALFGNNIGYSISPVIHNTAFQTNHLPYTYLSVDIAPERFGDALHAAQTLNFAGANVTIPFKETVLRFTKSLSDTARKIGAVNTLRFTDSEIYGDNTDSAGFFNAYTGELQLLHNKTVLIIGAGGAARAVCDAIITKISPERIVIANRTPDRAKRLAHDLKKNYNFDSTQTVSTDNNQIQEAADDAAGIIQTTPAGSGKHADQTPVADTFRFSNGQIVIDLIYNPIETLFLKNAAREGARTRNGISMLLHQAALSYHLWTGQTFPMDKVIPVVMEHIKRRAQEQKV